MYLAFSWFWTVLKAALAIGVFIGMSLYSAQIVDREGANPFTAALAEPTTTGSIKSGGAIKAIRMPQDSGKGFYSTGEYPKHVKASQRFANAIWHSL
jgi:hypothetical protein